MIKNDPFERIKHFKEQLHSPMQLFVKCVNYYGKRKNEKKVCELELKKNQLQSI